MNENAKRTSINAKDIPSCVRLKERIQEEYVKLCKVSFDDIPDYIPRSITIGEPTTPKTLKFCFPNGNYAEYKMDEQGCKDLQDFLKRMEQHTELEKQLKEANAIISLYRMYDDTKFGKATEYCDKWGVK